METLSYQKAKHKMVTGKPHISIVTLNVTRQNPAIKRYRVSDWIKKTKPKHMLPPGDTSQFKRQIYSKRKVGKRYFKQMAITEKQE